MIRHVPARILGGFLCAAANLVVPTAYAMGDEPPQVSEDVSDREIMPPGGGDEGVGGNAHAGDEERPLDTGPQAEAPATDNSNSEAPAPDRVVDHEAAKRALLSEPKPADKPNPLLDVRGPDYYDRRAKELLAEDTDKSSVELHPLMQAHPDSYVVVCTAGCPTGKSAQVVSLLPKRSTAPASDPAAKTAGIEVSCVAGCRAPGQSSFASAPESDKGTVVAATVGEWMTTVATAPANAAAPAPKPAGSGEWMDRINRERQEAKTAMDTAPAAKPMPSSAPKTVVAKETPAPVASPEAKPVAAAAVEQAKDAKPAPAIPSKPAVIAEAKPAAPVEAKPVAAAAVDPAKDAKPAPAIPSKPAVIAEAKPAAPVEAKPAVAAAVEQAKDVKPAPAVPSKPAVVAEAKPAAPVEAKPAAAAAVDPAKDMKPAPVAPSKSAVVAEMKPAAPVVAKPVTQAETVVAKTEEPKPAAVADVKPTTDLKPIVAAESKPAAVTEFKPAVDSKPVVAAEAKPATPTVQIAPAPTQMAALDPAKAPAGAASAKSTLPTVAAQEKSTPTSQAVPTQPAASATATKPAEPAAQETKVAALEQPKPDKPAPAVPATLKDRVISVLSEDKDMNAAIETARKSIATFWKSYEAPGPGETDHALKVAVAGNGTTEHFWLTRIKREDGKLSGVISNQPQSVTSVKMGQRYEFTPDMISDWTFKRNGKLVGNETMRVLLPRMPEQQAAVYRQMYETP